MKIHFFLALSAILILIGLSTIITGIFFRNENSISSGFLQFVIGFIVFILIEIIIIKFI
ncbi:hypothetical protein [Streptococcus halichoeri]|uniref:hypothetical protein n=1 Tax=Streptococcus halichoeri TaxID=254785 RepID=UPI001357B0FC|nr:hypothetical protein [Streptococcus halichoeri]